MPRIRVVEAGQHLVDHPRQQSFEELIALRASDEANADAVIAEILSAPPWQEGR